jgi:ribosomal protein S27E
VERWNDELRDAGRARYSPTISIAVQARYYFLDVFCPGCQQMKQLDLRTVDRHPQTRVEALIPSLSCRGCRPHAPFAVLRGLSKHKWASPSAPVPLPKRGI